MAAASRIAKYHGGSNNGWRHRREGSIKAYVCDVAAARHQRRSIVTNGRRAIQYVCLCNM